MARDIKKEKQEAALAKAIAMLAENGVDTSNMKPVVDTDYRSEHAVATVVHHPESFQVRRCRNCQKTFAHNHIIPFGSRVGFCSNLCAREDWKKTTGLDWNRISTRDPWDGDPPLIITPEQYENLGRIANWFNRNREALANAAVPQSTPAEPAWLLEEDQEEVLPPAPNEPQEFPVQPESEFDIFGEQQQDQDEPHTNPDAWIFQ